MARTHRDRAFASLHHVLDLEWMLEAYRATRKDGATGVDGATAADYAERLEDNLLDLLDRIKSGRYQAPPVRRSYIPKADGSQRPLGIPTFEDKVAQRAIVMVLEAIYEQDFLSCSYGFRPGRSAHDALHDLRRALVTQGMRWVLDSRHQTYFDTIPHCPTSTLPRPAGDGRRGPANDRQVAEGGGAGKRLPILLDCQIASNSDPLSRPIVTPVGAAGWSLSTS